MINLFKNLFCNKANKYKFKNENQKLIQEITDRFYGIDKKLKDKTMTLKEAYEYLVNYRANASKKQTIDYAIARVLPIIKHYCDEIDKEKLIDKIDDVSKSIHEYVDLGLSVKWATCNVGAYSPEIYGNYYAWGETEPKSEYSLDNYKFGGYKKMSKYCTASDYGTVNNLTTLEAADDAAAVNWGGKWRMPTNKEWAELMTKCTWIWTDKNGVSGYEIKSKNGNSIFLPAMGYCYNNNLYYAGSSGYYWSNTLDTHNTNYALNIIFETDDVSRFNMYRFLGLPIRPVYID